MSKHRKIRYTKGGALPSKVTYTRSGKTITNINTGKSESYPSINAAKLVSRNLQSQGKGVRCE